MQTASHTGARGLRTALLAAALIAAPATAPASSCPTLGAAQWLLGDWLADEGGRVVTESWRAAGTRTYEGEGATTARTSEAPADAETLRIVEMSGEVFYLAKVAHNPYPVTFRLTTCSGTRLVFENPRHDFPRRLEYVLVDDTTMTVAVTDGAQRGFTLRFRRLGAGQR